MMMNNRLVKNYLYNFTYQLFVLAVPLVTAPYLARVLGAENLGIYTYIHSSTNIISTICLLGIYNYGNRQIAYLRNDPRQVNINFWELMITRLIMAVVGTSIFLIYSATSEYFLCFILYFPYFLTSFIDCSWLFVGMEDMKPTVVKNFFVKLLGVICVFSVVKQLEDLQKYIFLLAISTLLANLSVYVHIKKYVSKPQFSLKSIPNHVKGASWLFLPQVASLIYLQVDKVMLEWLTGETAQISFYDQAEKLVTIPLTVISVLSTVMMPRIATEFKNGEKKQIESLINKAGLFSMFMAMPMTFGIASLASKLIPWYLGDEFVPTIFAMILMSPLIVFNTLAGLSGTQYFTATDQIGILMKAYISAAVCNIIVNVLLIPHYGYVGAAVATLLSSMVSVVVQYYFFRKQINLKTLIRPSIKYLLYSSIMALIIFIITRKMDAIPTTTCLQIIIGIVVYVGLILVTKDPILKLVNIQCKVTKIRRTNNDL